LQLLRQLIEKAPRTGAFLFLWTVASPVVAASCALDQSDLQAEVAQVIDGDTIRLVSGKSVRLIAINTPELGHRQNPSQPLARNARDALKRWIDQSQGQVQLRFDQEQRDRHRRLLAHVFLSDGRNLAELLLRDGLGFTIAVAPNFWQQAYYRDAEQEAERARRGVWADAYFAPIPARALNQTHLGFRRVSGAVQRIEQKKSGVRIYLTDNFHLWVNRSAWPEFTPLLVNGNRTPEVIARGWLTLRGKGFSMRLHHPYDLHLVD
jgi:endonuclease YncB( thermonuclease family)